MFESLLRIKLARAHVRIFFLGCLWFPLYKPQVLSIFLSFMLYSKPISPNHKVGGIVFTAAVAMGGSSLYVHLLSAWRCIGWPSHGIVLAHNAPSLCLYTSTVRHTCLLLSLCVCVCC